MSEGRPVQKGPQTATLAELYVRQGLLGRAREIFRALARGADPAAARLAERRLLELGPAAEGQVGLLQELLERVRRQRR